MHNSIKFYKIKKIKNITEHINRCRNTLLDEFVANATDPIIVKRRIRFLKHLNLYENQLIAKVQNFETDNLDDLNNFEYKAHIEYILNRCA
jgi:hypothetical protein